MNESFVRNVIEAALLAAGKSLQPAELAQLFDDGARPSTEQIRTALAALAEDYAGRGIEIKETAAGFRIQVRRELANEVSRLWPERPAKYSRALLETLALIAYRQPITRAEIEAVRGVAVNPNIIKTLLERNWVRVVGHRDVPGRPELLGTTRDFLDYFGLRSLDELPPLAQLKTLGELNMQLELPGAPVGDEAAATADMGASATAESNDPDGIAESAAEGSSAPEGAARVEGTALDEGELVAERVLASAEGDPPASDDAAAEADLNPDCDTRPEASTDADAELNDSGSSDTDDVGEEDELSAEGGGSRELVAAPRGSDD
jgi:segregation and condensation protein B